MQLEFKMLTFVSAHSAGFGRGPQGQRKMSTNAHMSTDLNDLSRNSLA